MAILWLDACIFHKNVVWLPGGISEAAVTSQICNSCTPGPVFKIQFKFQRIAIPHHYNVDHLGCIGGCDDTLKELIEICGTGPRNPVITPARGRRPMEPSSNAQRGTTRQSACVHCRQTGHSSNDCPSQISDSRGSQRGRRLSLQNRTTTLSCNACGEPCIFRTANTANNRGRKFYKCQREECNFFVWEDSIDNNDTGGGGARSPPSRGSRGRGRGEGRSAPNVSFVTATGEPISGRRCFICGDPSHFANVCPNRG